MGALQLGWVLTRSRFSAWYGIHPYVPALPHHTPVHLSVPHRHRYPRVRPCIREYGCVSVLVAAYPYSAFAHWQGPPALGASVVAGPATRY